MYTHRGFDESLVTRAAICHPLIASYQIQSCRSLKRAGSIRYQANTRSSPDDPPCFASLSPAEGGWGKSQSWGEGHLRQVARFTRQLCQMLFIDHEFPRYHGKMLYRVNTRRIRSGNNRSGRGDPNK